MSENKLAWMFPLPNKFLFRIEAFFVALVVIVVFIGSYFYFDQGIWYPLILTVVFLGLYILAAYVVRRIRQAESHFKAHSTHLEITHKTRNHKKTATVPLKHIAHHKLDKVFLGGYVLTHQGKKHQLFFNDKKEAVAFEKFMKRHSKK